MRQRWGAPEEGGGRGVEIAATGMQQPPDSACPSGPRAEGCEQQEGLLQDCTPGRQEPWERESLGMGVTGSVLYVEVRLGETCILFKEDGRQSERSKALRWQTSRGCEGASLALCWTAHYKQTKKPDGASSLRTASSEFCEFRKLTSSLGFSVPWTTKWAGLDNFKGALKPWS